MTSLRCPTPRQWLEFASESYGLATNDFAERCDLSALIQALDLPRQPRTANREHLSKALAVITIKMMRSPPFEHDARLLGIKTAEMISELNGCRLNLSHREREVALQVSSDRGTAGHRAAEAWFQEHLQDLPASVVMKRRVELSRRLGPAFSTRANVFVSAPYTRAGDEERDLVEKLREPIIDCVSMVVPHVLEGSVGGVEQRGLGLESSDPPPLSVHMPVADEPWAQGHTACDMNRPLVWRCNAHITIGIGGGSHSTGAEQMLVQAGAPHLYLNLGTRTEGAPTAVKGNLGLQRLEATNVRDQEAALGAIEAFLWRNLQALERSWRITDLREYTHGRLAAQFACALGGDRDALTRPHSKLPRRAQLLDSAGGTPELARALVCPAGLATLPADLIGRSAAALGFSSDWGVPHRFGRLSENELDLLSAYQREYDVAPSRIASLRRRGAREKALGVLSLSLGSIEGWADLDRSA